MGSDKTALLRFMDKFVNGMNIGKKIRGIFLDITKAFDAANHAILLDKFYDCGIRRVVYKWFKIYL